ncbi:sugar porter family MFS transporter, partial [Bacteroidota bacterium]
DLSDVQLGFTVASALIGTIVASISVGWPTDLFGRRKMLMWMGLLYFVSALGSALAWDWHSFLIFRFVGGLGVGGASVVSPMYIAEISPAKKRGRLVALAQFNIVLGILLAFTSNYIITLIVQSENQWRWMFAVEAVPAAAFFIFLFSNPRSPRWLILKNRTEEARKILFRLQGELSLVEEEFRAIQESFKLNHGKLQERFYSMKYIKPILLACAIAAFNQLSGINALMYYAPKIFIMAGAATESAMLQSVVIGMVNLIFTMLALSVIDRMGRKKLMLLGSIGYIISLGCAAGIFYVGGDAFTETNGTILLAALIVFIASHAFGQGAVVWVFISEIFPNQVRARGQALGAFTLWIFAAIISQTFPVVAGKLGGGPIFTIYCGFMVIQLIWVLVFMPETKGVPLEEIQNKLNIK